MKEFYNLRCVKCKSIIDEKIEYTNCTKCGSPLEVNLNYNLIAKHLNRHALKLTPIKATKYVDFYPIHDKSKINSMGEGGTPLYRCRNLGKQLGLKNLFIKYEGANPTGAFKDRGSMVEVTKAIELKKKAVILASTGNMAASMAAYCAKSNMPVYVLVPQGTPIGKLSQTLAYGSRIIQVRGSYDNAAKLTKKISDKHNYYLSGDYAYRLEGQKSQAYEIAEQLNWESPDKVIIPVGCGTNSSAIWKGFKEYEMFDFIGSTPQIIGVQAKGANPVVRAFQKKSRTVKPIQNPSTVSSAMCVGDPLDGLKILSAIYESKGFAIDVEDTHTLEAEKLLAKTESFFVEPSAATSLAALQKMVEKGKVQKDEKVVLVLTGQGLKDPVSALKVLYSPPTVDPEFNEVEKYLNYGFYDVVASKASEKEVLLKKKPSMPKLSSLIKKEFHTSLNKNDLEKCERLISQFFKKGKNILKGDLRYILEKVLRESAFKKKVLEIVDFKVEAGLHEKAKGIVKVKYKGKTQQFSDSGTGPVDCIINAVRKSVSNNGFKFRLTDYEVGVSEGGTEASVNVKMTLEDQNRNKVISMGTSPDIIVASVKAFEEGFNLLYYKNK